MGVPHVASAGGRVQKLVGSGEAAPSTGWAPRAEERGSFHRESPGLRCGCAAQGGIGMTLPDPLSWPAAGMCPHGPKLLLAQGSVGSRQIPASQENCSPGLGSGLGLGGLRAVGVPVVGSGVCPPQPRPRLSQQKGTQGSPGVCPHPGPCHSTAPFPLSACSLCSGPALLLPE